MTSLPTFHAAGTGVGWSASGGHTVKWPAAGGTSVGDIGILCVRTGMTSGLGYDTINDGTLTNFTRIAAFSVDDGSNGTTVYMYWARATSTSMANETVTNTVTGIHGCAFILTFTGCLASGDPTDAIYGSAHTTSSFKNDAALASGSAWSNDDMDAWPAVTKGTNRLVVWLMGSRITALESTNDVNGETNASLGSLTERKDFGSTSFQTTLTVMTGTKATVGGLGIMSWTNNCGVNIDNLGSMAIALRPSGDVLGGVQNPMRAPHRLGALNGGVIN